MSFKVIMPNELKFTQYTDIILWCTINCDSYETSDGDIIVSSDPNVPPKLVYRFYFKDESDAIMFALKWT